MNRDYPIKVTSQYNYFKLAHIKSIVAACIIFCLEAKQWMAADNHEWAARSGSGPGPVTGSSDSQQPDMTTRGIYHLIIYRANKQSLFWGGLTADQWQIHGIYFTIISWFAKSAFLQVLWSHSYGAVGIQKTFNKEISSLSQHTNRQKLGKFIVNNVIMRFPI